MSLRSQVFADEPQRLYQGILYSMGRNAERVGNLRDLHTLIPAHLVDPAAAER